MRTHAALLRGINVGGHNKVSMSDLREIFASLGHTEVVTYIQSGNAVFATTETDASALAQGLGRAIAERLALRVPAVVMSREDLASVIAENPFPEEADPKALHVLFMQEPPGTGLTELLAAAVARARAKGSRDEAVVGSRALYLRTPDGLGRSELSAELGRGDARREVSSVATARNWATVTTLLRLLDS